MRTILGDEGYALKIFVGFLSTIWVCAIVTLVQPNGGDQKVTNDVLQMYHNLLPQMYNAAMYKRTRYRQLFNKEEHGLHANGNRVYYHPVVLDASDGWEHLVCCS